MKAVKKLGAEYFLKSLAGFAEADDPYFRELKKNGIIGEHIILPETHQLADRR